MTDSLTFVGRSLRHSVRSVDALLTAILLPVAILLMFVYVFGGAIETDGRYVDYVVPGIIVLCAGFGSASTAVAVALDMTTGVIDRFRTLPISSAAVLTGHVAASVARNVVSTAARARRRAARRLPARGRPAELARRGRPAARADDRDLVARGVLRPARQERRGRQRDHVRRRVRAVRQQRVRARRARCRPACSGSPSTSR